MSELWRNGAVELAAMIRDREVSSREVVQAHLDRIEAVNPHLNAIVRLLPDQALAAADAADRAVADADVVVSAVSLHSVRQVMTEDWLAPDSLVVPIDYATFCHAEVARHAALFLVDDRGQFLKNRDDGEFEDYPDPTATIGEAILAGTARPEHGRVVVSHLGVGLADVIFGDAIVTTAERAGIGTLLPS